MQQEIIRRREILLDLCNTMRTNPINTTCTRKNRNNHNKTAAKDIPVFEVSHSASSQLLMPTISKPSAKKTKDTFKNDISNSYSLNITQFTSVFIPNKQVRSFSHFHFLSFSPPKLKLYLIDHLFECCVCQ
jgi:hypothetical protein